MFNDHISDFEKSLQKSSDIFSHHTNIHDLLHHHGFNVMYEKYYLQFQKFAKVPVRKKENFFFDGLETLSYRALQLWTLLLEEIRQRNTVSPFKSDVRHWICRVSLQIVQSV